MKKVFFQGLVIAAIFFSLWSVLARVEWVQIFRIQQVSDSMEKQLGEIFWDFHKGTDKELTNTFVVNSVDSIIDLVCEKNKINREKIKVHIVHNEEVNAYALPDAHLVINTGLITNAENQEEIIGVVCHEIAHIELNHVMKKMISEVGLSVLVSITTGNSGKDVIQETAKMLSSTAFDRSLEKDADIRAVDYLINAEISPEPFSNFLRKLADSETDAIKYLTWISTHPGSKERAEYVDSYSKGKKTKNKSILSVQAWEKLKNTLEE